MTRPWWLKITTRLASSPLAFRPDVALTPTTRLPGRIDIGGPWLTFVALPQPAAKATSRTLIERNAARFIAQEVRLRSRKRHSSQTMGSRPGDESAAPPHLCRV